MLSDKFAVYTVQGLEVEHENRYSRWMTKDDAEWLAEDLVQYISGTDSDIHTVRVLNGVGDQVWEMEVA